MESEHKWSTLGETCYITDGAHAKVERQESGVLYLTSKNFSVGSLKLDKVDYISEEDFSKLFADTKKSQRKLRDGDVLTGIIGTFGNVYRYTEDDHFGISSSVAILRPNQEILNSDFLYYVLTSQSFKATVEAYKGGSVQGYTNIATLKVLPIPLPDISIQTNIVAHLKALDQKIQLNRQTNQTLEQMAQALFKNWFVDFDPVIDNALAAGNPIPEPFTKRSEVRKALLDKTLPEEQRVLFPSEFEETEELGWVPKGWKITPFIKIIDKYIDNRGKTPPLVEVGIPLVEVKNMIDGEPFPNLDTKKRVTMETFNTWFRTHLEKKDILISTVGTIGRTSIVANTNFGIAQNVLGLRFGKKVTSEYMFYTIKAHRFQYDMDARLVTTVQSSIKRKDLNTIPILKPPFELLEEFSSICDNNLKFQFQKKMEIGTLTKLRDTLLPKLISGELRLPETDSVHKKTSDTAT